MGAEREERFNHANDDVHLSKKLKVRIIPLLNPKVDMPLLIEHDKVDTSESADSRSDDPSCS